VTQGTVQLLPCVVTEQLSDTLPRVCCGGVGTMGLSQPTASNTAAGREKKASSRSRFVRKQSLHWAVRLALRTWLAHAYSVEDRLSVCRRPGVIHSNAHQNANMVSILLTTQCTVQYTA
jgi:hypothetical protein